MCSTYIILNFLVLNIFTGQNAAIFCVALLSSLLTLWQWLIWMPLTQFVESDPGNRVWTKYSYFLVHRYIYFCISWVEKILIFKSVEFSRGEISLSKQCSIHFCLCAATAKGRFESDTWARITWLCCWRKWR